MLRLKDKILFYFRSKEEWKLWDIYLRIGQFSTVMSSQNLDKKRIKLLANSIIDPIIEHDNWYGNMEDEG